MITIDYSEATNLKEKLNEHGLIIIKNAELSIKHFEEISNSLGKPLITDKHVINENRTIQKLSNDGLFGNDDVDWHHDWSYGRGNYFGTILYNVKNAHLSPTWFCDMSKVPDELYFKYPFAEGEYYPPQHLHNNCFTEKQLRILEKQKVRRKFQFKHHITGERILYCSLGTLRNHDIYDTKPIKDWIEENSYKHEWEPNEILIWDNLKMIHKRSAFKGDRLLWRTQFTI